MSDKKKDIDVRFKFSLDAKPLGEMTKQLGDVNVSLVEAKAGASGFAEVLAKTQAQIKELGGSGELDILPGGADAQVQKAVAQIDLMAVKLAEVEAKAEAAEKKLTGVAEGTAEWDQANARLKTAELASEQTAVALREAELALKAAGKESAEGWVEAKAQFDEVKAAANAAQVELVEAREALGVDAGSVRGRELARELAEARAEMARLVQEAGELPDRLEMAAGKTRLLEQEAQSYEAALRRQGDQVDVYGDVSSRLSAVAGLAGNVSPEAAEATMIVADLVDMREQLPKLGTAIVEIGKQFEDARTAGKAAAEATEAVAAASEVAAASQDAVAVAEATVAGEGALAAPSLGAVAAGLGSIVVAVAPFAIAIGAVVALFAGIKAAFDAGAGAMDDFLDAQEKDIASRKEAALLAQTITKDQLAAREEEQRLSAEFAEKRLDDLQGQREAIDEMTAEMGAAFDPLKRNALAMAAGKLDEEITEATAALEEEQAALDVTTGYLRESAEARWAEQEAVKSLVDETKQLVAGTDRRIEGERRVADLVDSMTGEQLKAAQETARQDRQIAREKIAEYKRLAGVEEDTIARLEAKSELTDRESILLQAAYENLDIYNKKLVENEAVLDAAANREADLSAAAPLVEQRDKEREAVAALDAELQNEIETRDLARTATREQVREQLEALRSEEAAIRAMLPKFEALAGTSEEAAQKVDELKNRLGEISTQQLTLENVVMPAAFEREAKEAWQSGVEAFGKYQEDLAAMEAKYAESRVKVVEDANAKVLDIEAKAAESRAKTIQETAKKIADAETKAVEERAKVIQEQGKALADAQVKANQAVKDLEQDLARDRAKIVQDSAREEARIRRRQQVEDKLELQKHYKTLSDLALSRDVAGFVAAQQDYAFAQTEKTATRALDTTERREDTQAELQALKETGQQRIAEIKRQYFEEVKSIRATSAEKLAAIEQERVKEIDAAKRAGAEKLAEIEAQRVKEIESTRAAEAKKLADLEAGLLAEQAKRQASYAKELQDLEDHLAGRDATMQEGWAELEAGFAESLEGLGGDFELLTAAGTAAIEAGQVAMTEVVATHTDEQVAVVGEAFATITDFVEGFRDMAVSFAGEVEQAMNQAMATQTQGGIGGMVMELASTMTEKARQLADVAVKETEVAATHTAQVAAATKQLDTTMVKLHSTTKATAAEMALLAKSMSVVSASLPKRMAGSTINITLHSNVNNPRFGEFVSPSQYRREMEAMTGQVSSAFRKLVSDIQRAIG